MKTTFIKGTTVALFAAAVLSFVGCDKENQKGTVSIEFEHTWDGNAFALNQALVHPTNGDTTTFTLLRYYISTIQLTNEDGEVWSQEESYHLLDASGSTVITLEDVPADNYTSIKYLIGVDSTRNVSGAQTGALATSNDMFWSWNSGYIFWKAEGTLPDATSFGYHIGGFSGANNALRSVEASLGSDAMVLKNKGEREMHFMVDVAKIWDANFDVNTMATIHMPGAMASEVATNFQSAFTFDHVH